MLLTLDPSLLKKHNNKLPVLELSSKPPTCQESMLFITPNCLVRVKGVKVRAQQSMSNHFPAGSEFVQP